MVARRTIKEVRDRIQVNTCKASALTTVHYSDSPDIEVFDLTFVHGATKESEFIFYDVFSLDFYFTKVP